MDVKIPFFFSMLFVAAMTLWAWVHPADVLAQTSLPRLHKEGQVTRTPFLDQGCHALGCKHHVAPTKSLLVEDNFDMGPSIARSDSFDVVHYDLKLDMTDYAGQTMQGLATIDFTVLQGGGRPCGGTLSPSWSTACDGMARRWPFRNWNLNFTSTLLRRCKKASRSFWKFGLEANQEAIRIGAACTSPAI